MSDISLREDVINALEFDPRVTAASIGVSAEGGVVTLSGHVPTYSDRYIAEHIVMRVKGVKGIAQEIEVRPSGAHLTADDEIAKRALNLLRWTASVPAEAIKVAVTQGRMVLSGKVRWHFQRQNAENAVRGLSGVTSITNAVVIAPSVEVGDVRKGIEKALKRTAELDAAAIQVRVTDGTVTLEGSVHSYPERYSAELAVWGAPGVHKVQDFLTIS